MTNKHFLRVVTAALLALSLAACGGSGNTQQGSTPPTPTPQPSHTIDRLESGSIGSDSAMISVETARDSTVEVAYGTTMALGTTTSRTSGAAKTHAVPLSGLAANTRYYYRARAYDANNDMVESAIQMFDTTNTPAPPAHTINNLSVSSVGTNAATITWTTARDSTVQVAYGTTMALGSETTRTASLSQNHSVTLNGLTDNTTYYFRARAFDAGNALVESTIQSFTTNSTSCINANPGNYLSLLRNLNPGDTLCLEAGTYNDTSDVPGLPFFNMHGTAANPITITGPTSGPPAVILGRSTHNTVRFDNASYIVIKNLEIDGRDLGGAGVNGQGISHHITLENLVVRGVGSDQQIVGIGTKAPAWDWVVRNNTIIGAGTGIYFGNSNGQEPFVRGLIEGNFFRDTIGYNMQIKHQNPRPTNIGMPTGDSVTTIRYNVFAKTANGSTGGLARPNLLLGHLPLSGTGSNDLYNIYGNFFYENDSGESLFQGEGNIAMHNNVFVTTNGRAIGIQSHNDLPRNIRVFSNTVVASGTGINVTSVDTNFQQSIIGNAVFAGNPINKSASVAEADNITDSVSNAVNYLNNPSGTVGIDLDLFPANTALQGSAIDTSSINSIGNWNIDYNQTSRSNTWRGAYSGQGTNPGPALQLQKRSYTP